MEEAVSVSRHINNAEAGEEGCQALSGLSGGRVFAGRRLRKSLVAKSFSATYRDLLLPCDGLLKSSNVLEDAEQLEMSAMLR